MVRDICPPGGLFSQVPLNAARGGLRLFLSPPYRNGGNRNPAIKLHTPLESLRDFMEGNWIELLYPLATHVEPLILSAHIVGYHSCPIGVPLVGHRQMMQGGPSNGPHLPGVDHIELHVQGECGEV